MTALFPDKGKPVVRREPHRTEESRSQRGVENLSAVKTGILLPAAGSRLKPILRGISALTVFAFTLTSILPAGYAQQDQTLRNEQPEESSDVVGRLAELLRAGNEVNPAFSRLSRAIPAGAVEVQRGGVTIWETRGAVVEEAALPTRAQEQPAALSLTPVVREPAILSAGLEETPRRGMNRRDFLKAGSFAALMFGLFGIRKVQAQPPPVQPVVNPGPTVPFRMETGYVAQPNTWVLDRQSGQVFPPAPSSLQTARGMEGVRPVGRTFTDRWEQWLGDGTKLISRLLGWENGIPREDEVWNSWQSGQFSAGPNDRETLRSYIVWGPWLTPKEWWPLIFQGMRKAAGIGRQEVADKPHSRIYIDPYGVMSPYRPWTLEGLAEFIQQAREQGIEVVPIMGDPIMAAFPTAATFMTRQLAATGILIPDKDGVIKVAYDIEPDDLDDYRKGTDAEKKVYWENIIKIAEETQRLLSHRFQPMASSDRRDVEVTLFVPSYFPQFAERMGLKIPPGTRLVTMAYSNKTRGTGREIKVKDPISGRTLTKRDLGVADQAIMTRDAFLRDAARPADRKHFPQSSYGIAVDIGPTRDPTVTLWQDSEAPFTGKIGDRTQDAGTALAGALNGRAGSNNERVFHTHSVLDIIWLLKQGGPDPDVAAGRELTEYLNRGISIFGETASFSSGQIQAEERAPFGVLPNGRSPETKTERFYRLLAQRGISGAVGTGAILAHLKTLRDTISRLVVAVDPEAFLFGPDIGGLYTLMGLVYAEGFGDEARIQKMSRTIVDPSAVGYKVTLNAGEKVESLQLTAEATIQGMVYVAGTLFVKGTVVPAGVSYRETTATGRADGSVKVHGTRLRDGTIRPDGTLLDNGTIVAGRAVVDDPDVLADSKDSRRKGNDSRQTQLPSNGYDIYWTTQIENIGARKFAGFVQLFPHTGYGEAHDLNTEPVLLNPGEKKAYTIRLQVGRDDYGYFVEEEERSKTDPFVRKGRLLRHVPVSEGAFLINTSAREGQSEIAHAVGLPTLDTDALNKALRDSRLRRKLTDQAAEEIRANNLSALSPYALDRPLGVRVSLARNADPNAMVQAVRELIQNAVALKNSHGVTHVVVESADLSALVDHVVDIRRRFRLIDQAEEQETRAIAELAGDPAAVQLRRLLNEAQANGIKISFVVDGNQARLPGPDLPADDPRGSKAYFRILKNIMEDILLGVNTAHFLAIANPNTLRPEDLGWVVRLYGNAQSPLIFIGNQDAMVPVNGLRVSQAHDVTSERDANAVVQALEADRGIVARENRPLNLAILTINQCVQCGQLAAPTAEAFVTRLIGPAAASGPSEGGLVTPQWLSEQIKQQQRYAAPVARDLVAKVLNLTKISSVTTGHLSLQSQRIAPDPTRSFNMRVRFFNKEEGVLHSDEYPITSLQQNSAQPTSLIIKNVPRGRYSFTVEVASGQSERPLPGERALDDTPFVVIQGQPAFKEINPGVENWITAGNNRLRLTEEQPVTVTVVGRPRFLEEHWTATTESGTVLHFGRERTRQKLVYWVDNGAVTELVSDVPQRVAEAPLVIVGIPVKLQLDGSTGRMALEVQGTKVDFWTLLDQKLVSYWDQSIIVREDNQRVRLTISPDRLVPTIEVLAPAVPDPARATSIPTAVRNTTAEQVTPHSKYSEYVGEGLAWGSLAGVLGTVARGGQKAYWRLRTALRDARVRSQESQQQAAANQRAAARAQSLGQPAPAPRPVGERIPESPVGIGSRIYRFLRSTVTAVLALVLLTQVPAVGYLLLNGGFLTAGAALMKLAGIAVLVNWGRAALQSLAPRTYERLTGWAYAVIETFARAGTVIKFGTVAMALWILIVSGLTLTIPGVGTLAIPSLISMGGALLALQPLAFLALIPAPVLIAIAVVAAVIFIGWLIYQAYRAWSAADQEGTGARFLNAMATVAPWFFRAGVVLGIGLLFGATWPGLAAVSVFYLLKLTALYLATSYLGYLLIGNLLLTAIPGIPILTIPRMFENALGLQGNRDYQTAKMSLAQRTWMFLDTAFNRTPLVALVGFGGVAFLKFLPAIIGLIPVAGPKIAAVLMVIMTSPITGNIAGIVIGAGLLLIGGFWLWRTVARPLRNALAPGEEEESIPDYLRNRADNDMVTAQLGLPEGANADANTQQLTQDVYLLAIQQAVAAGELSPQEGARLEQQARQMAGLPAVPPVVPPAGGAGTEEHRNILEKHVVRIHAAREADAFIAANKGAFGLPGGPAVPANPGDAPNLAALITARRAEGLQTVAVAADFVRDVRNGLPAGSPQRREAEQLLASSQQIQARVASPNIGTLEAMASQLSQMGSLVTQAQNLATAGGLAISAGPVLAQLQAAPARLRAPGVLMNGLAFKWQPLDLIVQQDVGAKFAHEGYPGEQRTAEPWYGMSLREQVRELRRSASGGGVATFPGIFVFPSWEVGHFNLGFQVGATPIVFGSQFIQYQASMFIRWMLAHLPASQVRSYGAFVRSDMDPQMVPFASEVQGRWLTGHLMMFIMYGLLGHYFHWDPDLLKPKSFEKIFGSMQDALDVMGNSPDPAGQMAALYSRFHPFKNLTYGIGEQPEFDRLEVREWNDRHDGLGISDDEVLGGYHLEPGVKVIRLHGEMNAVGLHTWINFESGVDGQTRISDHPSKFDAWFGPSLVQTPKSARMGLALAILHGIYRVAPEMDGQGNVVLRGVTPWQQGSAAEVMQAHDAVSAARRNQSQLARNAYLDMARWRRSDRVRGPRSGLEEGTEAASAPAAAGNWNTNGFFHMGPRLGWDANAWRGGQIRQALYRISDILTLRRWAEGWPDADRPEPIRVRAKNSFIAGLWGAAAGFLAGGPVGAAIGFVTGAIVGAVPVARAVVSRAWYYTSPPLWIGIALFFTGGVGWLGLLGFFALSRFALEPFFRTPVPISFWKNRADPIISSYRYDYDPEHVQDLVERATGTIGQIAQADANGSERDFLQRGVTALQEIPNLLQWTIELGRGASPARYDENPNIPESEWEDIYVGLISGIFRQVPQADRQAAQYVMVRIVEGHRAAAGQPPDLITALNYGSHDPGVPSLGNKQRIMMWFRDHHGHATPHYLLNNLLPASLRDRVNERRRSWGWSSPATAMGGIRISSTHDNPVQAYLDSGSTEPYVEWLLRQESHLQPDTDSVVRTMAQRGRGGVSSLRGGLFISPEMRYSGMFNPGIRPHRFPIVDGILYHLSHALDSLGPVGRFLNRVLGTAASAGIGWWAATGGFTLLKGALVGLGLATPLALLITAAATGLVLFLALRAAVSSWHSFDGKDGYRLDQWVDEGWRGDGIRSLSLIPGFAKWVIYQVLLRLIIRPLDNVLPTRSLLYSLDARILAANAGQPVTMFQGMIHDVDWPLWFGPLPPGLPYGKVTLFERSATAADASALPITVALRLANEPAWTRVLSELNYLNSGRMTREAYPSRTLAEDTGVNEMMLLNPAGLPSSPAVSLWLERKLLYEMLRMRDDEDAMQRAMLFAKGMGMERANTVLRSGAASDISGVLADVAHLSSDQQLNFFISITSALEAFDRNEVSTAGASGASVYSYLLSAGTLSPLFSRVVGAYAPAEIEALLWYLMFAHIDQHRGGALARQIERIQIDRGALAGPAQIAPGQTLNDLAVMERLLQGTFIDPRMALSAVWLAEQNGTVGPIADTPTFHLSQSRRVSDMKTVTLVGIQFFPPSWGGREALITDAQPHLRAINRILRQAGKDHLIIASKDVLNKLEVVLARPMGAAPVAGLEGDPPVDTLNPDRREFLKAFFAGAALLTAASLVDPPETNAQIPPDPTTQSVRDLQGTLLANQAAFAQPRLRFLQANLERYRRLRGSGAISLEELQEAMAAVEMGPLIAAEGQVLALLRSYLSGTDPRPGEVTDSIRAQIEAAIRSAEAVQRFFTEQNDRAQRLLRLNSISREEADLIGASFQGSGHQLRLLQELARMYADLAQIGGYMPLPVARMSSVEIGANIRDAVPPLPGQMPRLTDEEKNRLLRSVRLHLFNILEIEKDRLDVHIDIRRRIYQRAADLYARRAISLSEREAAAFLNAQATQFTSLKNVLTAQQWILLVAGGIDHPRGAAGRPANLLQAQQRLDAAIIEQTGSLVLLAGARVTYRQAEFNRQAWLLERGATSRQEHSDAQYELRKVQVQRRLILKQQQLDEILRQLGFPASILQTTDTISGAIDIQALIQPAQIGLTEELEAEQIAELEINAWNIQMEMFDDKAAVADLEIAKLNEDAERIERLLARNAIGRWAGDDAADMRNETRLYEARKVLALAEKAIVRATNQESFTAAVDRYELAIVEVTNRERTRITARVAVLNERVRTASAPSAPYSREEIDFFRAQAEALTLRKNELDARVQLNTRFRENGFPLIDFDKPTGSSTSSASPESLKLVLDATQLGVGTARVHGDERSMLVLPGAWWVWLAGPPVLGEVNDWAAEHRMLRIRRGEPAEGNFILPEYFQQVRSDTGALEGPQRGGTVGKRLYVTSWGLKPYQLRSGYYRVEALEGGITLDSNTEAIRLGTVIRPDPADPTRQLPSTHGLIGFAAYAVRMMPTATGGTRREYAPIGVVVQQIPLEAYNRRVEGREAPIRLSSIGPGADGRPSYGEFFTGGLVTYGDQGVAQYGRQDNAGQRLVPVFERVGARTVPVIKEVRIVYDEQAQLLIVSFRNHDHALPQAPAPIQPIQQPQAQEEIEGQGWSLLTIGGLAVAGLATLGLGWIIGRRILRRGQGEGTGTSAQSPVTTTDTTAADQTAAPPVESSGTDEPPAPPVEPDDTTPPGTTPGAGLEELARTTETVATVPLLQQLSVELRGAAIIPGQVGELSRALGQMAHGPDLDLGIEAGALRSEIQTGLEADAVPAVQAIRADFRPADAVELTGLLFDETLYESTDAGYIAWAPFVAKSGASVAVLTQKAAVAEGLKKLFRETGLSADSYAVVSLEEFAGDRQQALAALENLLVGASSFPVVQPTVGFEMMKRVLEQMGFVVISENFKVDLQKVQSYLDSLA